MVIYNNMAAMSALNETNRNNNKLGKAVKQASSGMKINSAGDDASAYSISERMRVQVRALDQDIENTQTGRNMVATAEGGIQNIVENLRYLKEKAINAANDHNTDADRAFIQKEVNARLDEINDIASSTNYNGRILLNGDYSETILETSDIEYKNGISIGLTKFAGMVDSFGVPAGVTTVPKEASLFQLTSVKGFYGAGATDPSFYLDFSSMVKKDGTAINWPADLDKEGISLQCPACYSYTNIVFDAGSDVTASKTSTTKVHSTNPTYAAQYKTTYKIGVKNVHNATELAEAVYQGIQQANGGIGNTSLSGYNHYAKVDENGTGVFFARDNSVLSHFVVFDRPVGEEGNIIPGRKFEPLIIHTGTNANEHLRVFINDMHAKTLGVEPLEVGNQEKASAAIDKVNTAIEYALNEATRMGAYQSRLDQTEGTLTTSSENTTNAESVIRDADMAKTMMDYTKNNILTQASQSMLAQANQTPQNTLSLLQ